MSVKIPSAAQHPFSWARLSCFPFLFLLAASASAQASPTAQQAGSASQSTSAPRVLYPQKQGQQEHFYWEKLPSWLSFDVQLRGRTEEQTSLGYVSGKDRLYELTRIYGGATARPVDWLTGYVQFIDTHALGLPVRDAASNFRDTFDLRQEYLNFHYESKVQFIAGRQELKFGDERVVGISDWTNNSRTWDGFDLRLGEKNRVDLFSTSSRSIRQAWTNMALV